MTVPSTLSVSRIGVSNAGVTLVKNGCDARILNLNGKVERGLIKANPYYAFSKIQHGTYRTRKKDVTTFGVVATLVTSEEVAKMDACALVRATMENINYF